jgi:zinc/manganese transport system substrate-binding protein
MKGYLAIVLLFVCFFTPVSFAHAKLKVVASTPDLGSLAREVGGDRVEVVSLAKGTEDAHFVDAKPSFIRILNQADVLVEGGADLEAGWLPPLVVNARNSKIQIGQPGRIIAAEVIRLLEIPSGPLDRSLGDVHPFGNPHFTMDPINGGLIARLLSERFCLSAPGDCSIFQSNLKQFEGKIDARMPIWQKRMAPLNGAKAISYHKSYSYFVDRFRLRIVNTIEPKPGIPPSAAHVLNLVAQMKTEGVRLIVMEPNHERKTPSFLSQETGAKIAFVPSMVGGTKEASDYVGLFDSIIETLLAATGDGTP